MWFFLNYSGSDGTVFWRDKLLKHVWGLDHMVIN